MNGFRAVWAVVAAIVLAPLLFHVVHHRALPQTYEGEAFVAYVCGGDAVLHRRDPYLVEPLRSCEAPERGDSAGAVEPAPLPPVTLGFFALFATLPHRVAAFAWAAVLLSSYAVTCLGLIRLAPRVPPVAIWTALSPNLLVLNGFFGETPPLVAAGLVVAGLALRNGRYVAAAAAATVAVLFEPHVGGAAWLALFLFVPACRLPLFAGGVAAVGASVFAVGYATVASYVTAVLPAHALSELPANDQYSLTSLLYQLGVPAHAALTAGVVSYVAAIVAGCGFAPIVARRTGAPEMIVFLPAAAVLFGGTFIHDLQMSLALPLAVVVANGTHRPWRRLGYAAMLLAAIPQPTTAVTDLACGAAAAFAVAWSATREENERLAYALGAAAVTIDAAFAFLVHRIGTAPGTIPATFPAAPASASAEPSWTAFITAVSHPATPGELLTKLTVYALLTTTLILTTTLKRAPQDTPRTQKEAAYLA